jgi:hypothetical protein
MGSGRVPGSIGYDGGLLDIGTIPFPPNAGFEARGHLGQGDASITGPRLTGWLRQVSWSEFQEVATRPAGETEDAQIDTQTLQPERVGIAREQGQFRLGNFTVKLNVIRDNSWVVANQKSDTLLAHEQGHFDVTGSVARDLVKALGALRVSTTDELQREVSRLFEAYDAWAKSLSKQYDEETNHGRNAKSQSDWESRIRTCIQQGTSLGTPPR